MNDEKDEKNGLKFTNKDIVKYISGPVSMHYMKPKEDALKNMNEE